VVKYILSYTTASLSVYESEVMAGLYLESGDWSRVRESVIDENVLQKGSLTGRKRLFIEVQKDLKHSPQNSLTFILMPPVPM